MEFFDWLEVPQIVISYMNFTVNSSAETASRVQWILIICVLVAAALYLSGLLCGGIGLMTMAKRRGMKIWWLGFLPFGNTYLTGKLAGETRIFGTRCKRIGLYTMLAEILYVLLQTALLVMSFIFIHEDFYVLQETETSAYYEFSSSAFISQLPEYAWLLTLNNVLSYITRIWGFVLLFLMCFMFSALFRKYYARSPFLMTFLCALLPLRGFVLLAVRKNTPMDYNEYIRRRYEQMYRQQQQPPYGGQGGYGSPCGGYNQGDYTQGGGENPFSEFGGSPNGGSGAEGNSSGESGGGNGGGSNDSPFSDF